MAAPPSFPSFLIKDKDKKIIKEKAVPPSPLILLPQHEHDVPFRPFASPSLPARSRLYEGLKFYVEQGFALTPRGCEIIAIIRRLKGIINPTPISSDIIIIDRPPHHPTSLLLSVPRRLDNVDTSNSRGLVAKFGRILVGGSACGSAERTVVVRGEWVDLCLQRAQVVGEKEGYGGWEVRGTHDPRLVTVIPPSPPPPPHAKLPPAPPPTPLSTSRTAAAVPTITPPAITVPPFQPRISAYQPRPRASTTTPTFVEHPKVGSLSPTIGPTLADKPYRDRSDSLEEYGPPRPPAKIDPNRLPLGPARSPFGHSFDLPKKPISTSPRRKSVSRQVSRPSPIVTPREDRPMQKGGEPVSKLKTYFDLEEKVKIPGGIKINIHVGDRQSQDPLTLKTDTATPSATEEVSKARSWRDHPNSSLELGSPVHPGPQKEQGSALCHFIGDSGQSDEEEASWWAPWQERASGAEDDILWLKDEMKAWSLQTSIMWAFIGLKEKRSHRNWRRLYYVNSDSIHPRYDQAEIRQLCRVKTQASNVISWRNYEILALQEEGPRPQHFNAGSGEKRQEAVGECAQKGSGAGAVEVETIAEEVGRAAEKADSMARSEQHCDSSYVQDSATTIFMNRRISESPVLPPPLVEHSDPDPNAVPLSSIDLESPRNPSAASSPLPPQPISPVLESPLSPDVPPVLEDCGLDVDLCLLTSRSRSPTTPYSSSDVDSIVKVARPEKDDAGRRSPTPYSDYESDGPEEKLLADGGGMYMKSDEEEQADQGKADMDLDVEERANICFDGDGQNSEEETGIVPAVASFHEEVLASSIVAVSGSTDLVEGRFKSAGSIVAPPAADAGAPRTGQVTETSITSDSPEISIAEQLPHLLKKVFEIVRNVPISFFVAPCPGKTEIENQLVAHGGIITQAEFANIIIIPLRRGETAHTLAHQKWVRICHADKRQIPVSHEWIEQCIAQGTLVPVEDYRVELEGTDADTESGGIGDNEISGLYREGDAVTVQGDALMDAKEQKQSRTSHVTKPLDRLGMNPLTQNTAVPQDQSMELDSYMDRSDLMFLGRQLSRWDRRGPLQTFIHRLNIGGRDYCPIFERLKDRLMGDLPWLEGLSLSRVGGRNKRVSEGQGQSMGPATTKRLRK